MKTGLKTSFQDLEFTNFDKLLYHLDKSQKISPLCQLCNSRGANGVSNAIFPSALKLKPLLRAI